MKMAKLDFLRGRIVISRGSMADYRALAHLHYVPGDPAVVAGVWKAEFFDFGLGIADFGLRRQSGSGARTPKSRMQNPKSVRLIGVAVLCYPTPALAARDRTFGLSGPRYGKRLRWVNRQLRTIARVIVHPQFRSLGVASRLVRRVLLQCPTRYVEAVAAIGAVHPFFQRAGMTRVEPAHRDEAAYFLFDREKGGD